METINELLIGESVDYKFGLITYEICRVEDEVYELTDTSSGWYTATLSKRELTDLLKGELTMLELNWY